MLSATTRQRRTTTVNTTSSGFHNVRVQEYERDNSIFKLDATRDSAPYSYFVQELQTICADQLAKNFVEMPEIDTLQSQEPHLYDMVLSCLPEPLNTSHTSLPLRVCVERVSEESYWKRCCMSRWSSGQLSAFLGNNEQLLNKVYGWKELYLEHFLSDFLLSLRGRNGKCASYSQTPCSARKDDSNGGAAMWASEEDLQVLADLCVTCRDYIHTVELPCQFTHLNWYNHFFSMLPHARSFRLSYGVSNAGTDYKPSMMGFTQDDAESIRLLLSFHPLEKLRIPNTRLRDPHTMAICAGLVNNQSLRVLDLSHNAIGDGSVCDALAVLLSQPGFPLEELYLGDNNITGEGARALAEALEVNKSLRILHLDQNRIPDENAGDLLVRAVGKAPALRELNLGCNAFGSSTAVALIEVLPQLQTLRSLNLAGNYRLGGGYSEKSLADLSGSETLLTANTSFPCVNVSVVPQQPDSNQEHCESINGDAKDDTKDVERLLEPVNTEDGFVSVLSLSNKDIDPNEKDTSQKKDEDEGVSAVAASSQPCMKISATGLKLLKTIYQNSSLRYIDVRRCGFTTNEEQAIERLMRSRPSIK
ncbi:unnamed protein product [Phytomonas sp. EM1]|nr:unnamed protein product [Phytomonas sp. EM1]|eukprot:CCW63922.1 unnamed protein product [Phytomonas sp. isolate EM1]